MASRSSPAGGASSSTEEVAGWLTKQGAVRKSWKKRYFQTSGSYLAYFKSEAIAKKWASTANDKLHLGKLDMTSAVVTKDKFEEFSKSYVFSVYPANMPRRFVFTAESEEDRQKWCSKIVSTGATFQVDQPLFSVDEYNFEGFLTKLGGNRRNWLQRWFVLGQGKLSYYKEKFGKDKPLKSILIVGGRVRKISKQDCGFDFAFGVNPRGMSRMFVLFAASEIEMNDWIEVLVGSGCIMNDDDEDPADILQRMSSAVIDNDQAEGEGGDSAVANALDVIEGDVMSIHVKKIISAIDACKPGVKDFSALHNIIVEEITNMNTQTRRDSDGMEIKHKGPESTFENVSILTMILLAVTNPSEACICLKKLLALGADVNEYSKTIDHTILDFDQGVKRSYQFCDVTALHVALVLEGDMMQGNDAVLQLLEAGGDVNLIVGTATKKGTTLQQCSALVLTMVLGSVRQLEILLQYNADCSQTALSVTETFKQVTRRGAGLYKNNKYEKVAPLHLAVARKDRDLCELLIAGGASSSQVCGKVSIDQTFPGPQVTIDAQNCSALDLVDCIPEQSKEVQQVFSTCGILETLAALHVSHQLPSKTIITINSFLCEVPAS